jgi:hypothetical protein
MIAAIIIAASSVCFCGGCLQTAVMKRRGYLRASL